MKRISELYTMQDNIMFDKECLGSSFPKKMKTISIEGNIGVGKSTLIANLEKTYQNIKVLCEKFHQYDENSFVTFACRGRPALYLKLHMLPKMVFLTEPYPKELLEAYYKGGIDCFTFERKMITEKYEEEKKALLEKADITVFDRGVESCLPFIRVALADNKLSVEQYSSLVTLMASYKFDFDEYWFLQPSFLNNPIEVYQKNICRRARPGEELIPKELLYKIEVANLTWLLGISSNFKSKVKIIENKYNDYLAEEIIYDLIAEWMSKNKNQ